VGQEVRAVGEEFWIGVGTILVMVLVAVVETAANWGVGGWLDVRSSQTADEVRRNIDEYGPEAPGLKLHLLPEQERQAVLKTRAELAEQRAARKAGRR
jgi:hypothetical protein